MPKRVPPCPVCRKPQTPDYKSMPVVGTPYTTQVFVGYSCKRDHNPVKEYPFNDH